MKIKFLTLLLLSIIALTDAQAQWNLNGTTANYTAGNVAIGRTTTYVDARLHVKAPTVSSWGFMSEASSNSRVVGVGHDGTAGYISVSDADGLSGFSPLNLRTSNLVRVGIATNGNVGIGNQSPDHLLQVYNTNSPNNPTLAIGKSNANTAGQSTLRFFAGNGTINNSFDVQYNKTASTDRLGFFGGVGDEILTLENPSGNVGIGNNDPQYRLDVKDTKPGADLRFRLWNNTTNSAGTETRIDLPVFNGAAGLSIRSMGTSAAGGFNVGFYDAWMHTGQDGSYLHLSAGDAQTHAKKHLTIRHDGYVGIGTTNPDKALTVKGTVHAEEVLVDLNVPGPDYVFEKNYDLLSLEEVEAYINQNKHLPEVPSAKEMEANGIKLMEMNLLLLKKVEELTLHMIELKKENEQQSREIQKLKEHR